MEVNSEGSAFVCVPDNGTADAVATALSAPVPARTDPSAGGPSRASVIGLAVGVAAAGAALLMLALLAAVYVVLRARGGSRSGSQKRTLLGAAAMPVRPSQLSAVSASTVLQLWAKVCCVRELCCGARPGGCAGQPGGLSPGGCIASPPPHK